MALPLGCAPTTEPDQPTDSNSTATTGIPARDESTPGHPSTLFVFAVDGMQCPAGCPPVVKRALESVEGVDAVEVDYAVKQARVRVDAERFDQSAAVQALADAGFQGKLN
jgi:mercuric ion binding protein